MADTITYLKRSADRPRLMLAGGGPKMLALAAQEADIVTFSWQPKTTEAEAQSIVDRFRTLAGPRLPEIELKPGESVMTKGALGARIQSLLVKPPGFDPSKKYPALVLIHGGPQSAWDNAWSYRWNAQMFASHGYVVMMTNFHGSTGYGQRFVEEISRDWGGAPYQDLMLATDYLESLPYVDRTRIGAAGASGVTPCPPPESRSPYTHNLVGNCVFLRASLDPPAQT